MGKVRKCPVQIPSLGVEALQDEKDRWQAMKGASPQLQAE